MALRPAYPLLAEAARALHAETDLAHLLAWVAGAARTLTGAGDGGVWGPDRGWTCSPAGPDGDRLSVLGDLGRAGAPSLRRLLRDDAVLLIDDLAVGGQALDLRPLLPGLVSLLGVGVARRSTSQGEVIAVASTERGHFTEDDVAALSALGAHVGVALDNLEQRRALEQARATERQIVDQLQEAVVPARPDVPLTELGAFYSPADPGTATGGDLHDWILLPNGDLHFAVVDVMGKGVAATKDALAVTHVLRLLVIDGCPLENLVARADAIVTAQSPELVATLLVGAYRPSTGLLRLAGGGHPPALLVRGEQATALMAPGIPIGWPGAGSDKVVETELVRSDTVIVYTDGLIEGGKDIVEGLASLTRFAEETAGYPAQQLARVLIERTLAGAARRDDSLALILRCRTPVVGAVGLPLGPFEHRLSRSTAAVSVSRRLLRDWLVRVPVESTAVEDLLLAATELCANAVEHARWTGTGVVLRARTDDADVIVEVEDDGDGLTWPYLDSRPPDPTAEYGRGLWLVHTFCDDVHPEPTAEGTIVRCVKTAVVTRP